MKPSLEPLRSLASAALLIAACSQPAGSTLDGLEGPDGNGVAADTDVCQLEPYEGLPVMLKGTLTPLWSQHYVGSDLAHASMAEVQGAVSTRLAFIDGGYFREHLEGLAEDARFHVPDGV